MAFYSLPSKGSALAIGLSLTGLSYALCFGCKFLIPTIGRLDDKQGGNEDNCLP